MIVELTSLAAADAAGAAVAYEAEVPGLGSRFDVELDRVMTRIGENPLQFPLIEVDVRRALVKVFPFSVFFVVLDDHVRVFAVLHQHQHPDTWKPRR